MTPNDPIQTTQGTQPINPTTENVVKKDNFDIEINLDTSISSPTENTNIINNTPTEDEISLDLSDITTPSPAMDTPSVPVTEIKPTETESLALDLPSEPTPSPVIPSEVEGSLIETKPAATSEDRLKTEDKIVETTTTQPTIVEEKKAEVVEIKTETAPIVEENPIMPEAKPVEEKAPTADFSIEKDKAIIGEIQNMTSSTPNLTPAPIQAQEVVIVQPVANTGINLDMFTTPIYAQQQITTQAIPTMPISQPVSHDIKIPKVNNILMYGIGGLAVLVIGGFMFKTMYPIQFNNMFAGKNTETIQQ